MKTNLILIFLLLTTIIYSQKHICGVSTKDQILAEELFARGAQNLDFVTSRGDKLYIPIKFHLVGDNNGKGAAGYNTILNQLDRLNDDYAKFNFVFYLKDNYDFGVINSTLLSKEPRANEDQLASKKDPKAINVFVVKEIGASGVGTGIVLGYFSPSNDLLVLMESEAVKQSNTLSHECGHFFNLRHTFHGWESSPYMESEHGNPCVFQLAPGTNIQVEKVDKSNCKVAADLLCDTPPDYNFGLNANGCVWGKSIKDINGDLIVPMKNNHMSYFSDCLDFTFTADQETRMRSNYANSLRNYLKSTYIPIADTLPSISKIVTPKAGSKEEVYTSVYFEWENQKASTYLLEVKNSSEYHYYWVKGDNNSYTATDLSPNKLYVWSVRGFHEGYTGTTSPQTNFRTGTLLVGTNDLPAIESIQIYPNPLKINESVNLKINALTNEIYTIDLVDISGKKLETKQVTVNAGENEVIMDFKILTSGVYLLNVGNNRGVVTKKVIVQE
jgi:hypothetical protein